MKKRSLRQQKSKKQLRDFEKQQIPVKQTTRIKGGDGEEGEEGIVVVDIIIP